jgi:transposase
MEAQLFYGVDVSQRTVAIARYGEDGVVTLANEGEVLKAWLKTLPKGSKVAVESTGHYHEALVKLADKLGLAVYVLNPRLIKRYREAVGVRAKTDRCDAHLIARYLAKEHQELHVWKPMEVEQLRLQLLLRRRREVVDARTALRQSFQGFTEAAAASRKVFDGLSGLVKALEQQISALLNANPARQAALQRLQSIPGIGQLNAAALWVVLEHYAFTNDDAFVAFLGLDPRPRDSGNLHGKRHLSHRGDAFLRSLLYMAAMTGRRSPHWKGYYQRQLDKGLKAVQALVVLARKLARVAFALHASGQSFNPARLHNA